MTFHGLGSITVRLFSSSLCPSVPLLRRSGWSDNVLPRNSIYALLYVWVLSHLVDLLCTLRLFLASGFYRLHGESVLLMTSFLDLRQLWLTVLNLSVKVNLERPQVSRQLRLLWADRRQHPFAVTTFLPAAFDLSSAFLKNVLASIAGNPGLTSASNPAILCSIPVRIILL